MAASTISEFHIAVGQLINYRIALEEQESERRLYLAIPLEIYKLFFNYLFIQTVIRRNQITLIIYDVEKGMINQWIN